MKIIKFILKCMAGLFILWSLIMLGGLYLAFNGDTEPNALRIHNENQQRNIKNYNK